LKSRPAWPFRREDRQEGNRDDEQREKIAA